MFWFGLGGGIWSPLVRFTALFYQPWIQIIPFAFGGIMDVGPIVGLQVHKRVATYFRYLLWCPLPSGILIYDEFENKFSINYQNFNVENFKKVSEIGLGIGFGLNFGITGNQIDFGYNVSKRKNILNVDNELLQNFSIGISVADLWFVKRREI